MKRPPPSLPDPNRLRSPRAGYGWLDARLLRGPWLDDLGVDAVAVLTFLALAADRRGASWYGRARIAARLGIELRRVSAALDRLVAMGLVGHRPWRPGGMDGVWQILAMPSDQRPASAGAVSIADIMDGLRGGR